MTPFHYIGDFVRQLLLQVPLGLVRVLFLALLIALAVWVLLLPREQTTRDGSKPKLPENLKFWAVLTLGIQVAIYLLF